MYNVTAALYETSQIDPNVFIASKRNVRTNKGRNPMGCEGLEEVGVVNGRANGRNVSRSCT
jgi:hypothetical protein